MDLLMPEGCLFSVSENNTSFVVWTSKWAAAKKGVISNRTSDDTSILPYKRPSHNGDVT